MNIFKWINLPEALQLTPGTDPDPPVLRWPPRSTWSRGCQTAVSGWPPSSWCRTGSDCFAARRSSHAGESWSTASRMTRRPCGPSGAANGPWPPTGRRKSLGRCGGSGMQSWKKIGKDTGEQEHRKRCNSPDAWLEVIPPETELLLVRPGRAHRC